MYDPRYFDNQPHFLHKTPWGTGNLPFPLDQVTHLNPSFWYEAPCDQQTTRVFTPCLV